MKEPPSVAQSGAFQRDHSGRALRVSHASYGEMVATSRHIVLYVDCDPRTFTQGVLLLRALGYSVIASMEADAATRIIATEPISLAILCGSVRMTAQPDLVTQMRAIRPDMPIVLFAADGAQERLGAELFDHVMSDTEHRSLPQILDKLLARRSEDEN